jgi:hypothetical protein
LQETDDHEEIIIDEYDPYHDIGAKGNSNPKSMKVEMFRPNSYEYFPYLFRDYRNWTSTVENTGPNSK